MNNKFPVFSLILFIACFAGAIYISHNKIPQTREKMFKDVPEQLELVYLPAAGLDKFYADTQWVQLIQEMASQSIKGDKKDKNKSEKENEEAAKKERAERAQYFYNQLDRLTDLDPNNEAYYMFGAMQIMNDQPEEAIKLLQKGDRLLKSPSWEYPFRQYHIIRNIIANRDEQKLKEFSDDMSKLLKDAMDRSNSPAHIQKKWLRLEAKRNGLTDDDLGRLQLWANYYKKKAMTSMVSGESESSVGSQYQDVADNELLNQVLTMAQTMAIENWKKQKTADAATKEKLQKEHETISKIFFEIAPKGHYSPVSLMPYAPGDLFDANTGTPVKPYGVDPELLEKGIIVIYKGPYSHVTGKPRVEDKE